MAVAEERRLSAGGSVLLLTGMGAVSHVLGFFYRVALSRMVGAEVMGLYQLVMPVFSVVLSCTAVGLTAAVSNLTARRLALEDRRGADQVLRTCLWWMLGLLLPVGAALIWWSDGVSVWLLGDARTQLGLILLVPCAAFTGVENLHKHAFYGAGTVGAPAAVELLEQVVRAAAVLGLLVLFLPQYPERVVGLIVAGMVICEVFSSCALVLLYHRRRRRQRLTGEGLPRRQRRCQIFAVALPVGTTALLGNLMGALNAGLIPQKLVEGGMERRAAVAEFGVVCGMTLPMLALPTVFLGAVGLVITPRLARWAALGQWEQARAGIGRALTGVSLLVLPAMGLMAVLGGELGALLFQQQGVSTYLLPLAGVMTLGCYQSTFAAVLSGVGRQGTVAWISIVCDVVQLAGTAWLVPQMGMGGYVASSAAAGVLGLLLCTAMVVRVTKLRMQFFQWVAAPGLSALLMTLTCRLLMNWMRDSGVSALCSVLCVAGFGVALYLSALSAQGVSLAVLLPGRPSRGAAAGRGPGGCRG